ncbi:MAG: AI-2E family transporter [Magnetococcales bacterium]|nr:AI-2E family transporter [Magnetococcales bacterium]
MAPHSDEIEPAPSTDQESNAPESPKSAPVPGEPPAISPARAALQDKDCISLPEDGDAVATMIYEEGFLGILLLLAATGLIWLFFPFMPGLFLALLLCTSTWPFYRFLQKRFPTVSDKAAGIMTVLMFLLVISPVIYLLTATGVHLGRAAQSFQRWFDGVRESGDLREVLTEKLDLLPFPVEFNDFILDLVDDNVDSIGGYAANTALHLFRGITDNSLAFISSLLLISFALYFFYRDGPSIVTRIKHLTPLTNDLDDFIFNRFSSLATVLTMSTLGIAILQGASFSLVTALMGIDSWFYLGVAIAMASFIPVAGGFIVWGPLVYYLYMTDHVGQALFLAFWGAVVTGFVIDNLVRPLLIGWLSRLQGAKGEEACGADVLDHTLLTTLSTFGGLIAFGILGLLFGPMIAAMAITVFDVYEMKYGHLLDRS